MYSNMITTYLFVGKSKNLLIKSTWGCGPDCTQEVEVFEVKNNKTTVVLFEKLISSDIKSKYKTYFKDCTEVGKFGTLQNENCAMLIGFPKIGTQISLYAGKYLDDQKYMYVPNQPASLLSKLSWNKSKFMFE